MLAAASAPSSPSVLNGGDADGTPHAVVASSGPLAVSTNTLRLFETFRTAETAAEAGPEAQAAEGITTAPQPCLVSVAAPVASQPWLEALRCFCLPIAAAVRPSRPQPLAFCLDDKPRALAPALAGLALLPIHVRSCPRSL